MDCLRNLSELSCHSNNNSELFHQLSRTCHNIQSLNITIRNVISDGLADLISNQQNLKSLSINNCSDSDNFVKLFSSVTKLPNDLIKLHIGAGMHYTSLSLIFKFTNLRELSLTLYYHVEDFETLQHVTFSQLQILKFKQQCPNHEPLIKFLENNGKNLKEIHLRSSSDSLNLAIAKFCPNLKLLHAMFREEEVETFKVILNGCQQLESVSITCNSKLLEVVAKCSPKNFYELTVIYKRGIVQELEHFFISWQNRASQKPLSLTILKIGGFTLFTYDVNEINEISMEIIERFKKLCFIKKFEFIY